MSGARASKGARSAWDEEPAGGGGGDKERASSLEGRAERVGRGAGGGERRSSGAAVSPHGRVLRGCLLLVPRRAGGGVDGGRRERRGRPPTGAVWTTREAMAARRSARARRASDMDATVGGEWSGGRQMPAHPYLARQMSDHGFRQTLKVRTLGCARRLCPLPLRLAKI